MNDANKEIGIVKAGIVIHILAGEKLNKINKLLPRLSKIDSPNEFIDLALEKLLKVIEGSIDELNKQFTLNVEDIVIEEIVEFSIGQTTMIDDIDFRVYPLDDEIFTVVDDEEEK